MKLSHSALLCSALCLTVVACGGAGSQIHQHIVAGEYEAAFAESQGNNDRELELALLILEASAPSMDHPSEPLERLGHAGRRGRPMLERLEQSPDEEVQILARLYLLRGELPDEDQRPLYLESVYSSVRRALLDLFGRKLDSDALIAALIDIDPAVRVRAIRALASRESTPSSSQAARETALKDPDSMVRQAAAQNPSVLGSAEAAYEVLTQALAEEDLGIQLAAIRGLGKLENPSAIDRLKEIAAGPLNEPAVAAAAELIRLDADPGASVIETALADDRPSIRTAALLQLERIDGSGIKKALTTAIADKAPEIALLAAELGYPRGGKLAEQALQRAEELYADPETPTPLRQRARDLLALGGHAGALEEIKELLKQEDSTAIATLIPLVSRIRALQPQFAGLLAHSDQQVRIQAAYAVIANTLS